MISTFYQKFALRLLLLTAAVFPVLYFCAETIPSNNDIEAWLPEQSTVRREYEQFKSRFGAEEVILIGLDEQLGVPLIESVRGRIERLPSIRACWSPKRFGDLMRDHGVTETEINERLSGFFVSKDGRRVGIVAMLSESGLKNRAGTVDDIRRELSYCQLESPTVSIAGAPVVIAELNRLGGRESNKQFLLISLGICLCLLYFQLRDWRLTLSILGLTVFAIELAVSILHSCGGEMNFVIDALPVMVMVFTLEVSVHLLNYYQNAEGKPDRIGWMLRHAFKPCFLATFTTAIGLWSLCWSEFVPVRQFGWAGAMGSIVALVVGLFLTPAVIVMCPPRTSGDALQSRWFDRLADWFLVRSRPIVVAGFVAVLGLSVGLTWLRSHIDPLKFLPKDSVVLKDVQRVRAELCNTDTIEAIVDFGSSQQLAAMPFVEKLEYVRNLERMIASHPRVTHTMSVATMFPTEMPSGLELTKLLNRATKRQNENDFLSGGEQYWRISANILASEHSHQTTFDELRKMVEGKPVMLTGISPLIEKAQRDIYYGFWSSFISAFGMITLVMIGSLRWWKAGLIGMLPNVAPIAVVFGFLGWIDYPVDIGMMMSGSIALGIAVDGAFHFLVRYQEIHSESKDIAVATRESLQQTGPPILKSTLIMSIGMLALTFSSFGPTAMFGWLMCATLLTSLLGDLVLLPCLLGFSQTKRMTDLRSENQDRNNTSFQGPHFAHHQRDGHDVLGSSRRKGDPTL